MEEEEEEKAEEEKAAETVVAAAAVVVVVLVVDIVNCSVDAHHAIDTFMESIISSGLSVTHISIREYPPSPPPVVAAAMVAALAEAFPSWDPPNFSIRWQTPETYQLPFRQRPDRQRIASRWSVRRRRWHSPLLRRRIRISLR